MLAKQSLNTKEVRASQAAPAGEGEFPVFYDPSSRRGHLMSATSKALVAAVIAVTVYIGMGLMSPASLPDTTAAEGAAPVRTAVYTGPVSGPR